MQIISKNGEKAMNAKYKKLTNVFSVVSILLGLIICGMIHLQLNSRIIGCIFILMCVSTTLCSYLFFKCGFVVLDKED